MKFEFYVLNYNNNSGEVEPYNIFNNIHVQESSEREIKKYLRSPGKYKYDIYPDEKYTGFEALCVAIEHIIMWQEWSRVEYEISVGEPFEDDCKNLKKIDCYYQAKNNIKTITRDIIKQYKDQLKNA